MMVWRGLLIGAALISLLAGCSPSNVQTKDGGDPAKINVELGKAYIAEGKYQVAMGKLEKALSANENYAPAHAAIAELYNRLERYPEARKHYRRAVELDPKDSVTRNNFGAFLCEHGDLAEAQKHLIAAASDALYPNPEYAYTNAGLCALRVPDRDKAEQYFRSALRKNPRFSIALYQMAKLMYEQERYLKARAYIQRYLEVGRQTPEVLWLAVRTEKQLGDEDAVSSYALRLRSRFPEADQTQLLQDMQTDE